MVKLPTEALTKGELVSGIVGTVDIGSLISQSITFAEDMNRGQAVLDRINNYCSKTLPSLISDAQAYAAESAEAMIAESKSLLPVYLKFLHDNIRNQTVQGAGGFRIAATMIGQETKLYSALNQVDLLNQALFGFPEAIAKTKLARYWNKTLPSGLPNERDAYTLAVNGYWKFLQFTERYQTEEGFTASDARFLATIRQYQYGKPSLHDAWSMVKKGLKSEKYFYDLAMLGQGWEKLDAKTLFEYYDYDPSPMEILRLSDFVPLEASWIDTKLSSAGLNTEDKAIYKAALEKRVLRDEVSKTWTLFLDNYQWGMLTDTELANFLAEGKFNLAETAWRTTIADLVKTKNRVKLMRDAEIYLFRKAIINEDLLLTRLQTLGISLDIANAIVRNEAAKQGVDWEIPE
jgi:hypothetical protein